MGFPWKSTGARSRNRADDPREGHRFSRHDALAALKARWYAPLLRLTVPVKEARMRWLTVLLVVLVLQAPIVAQLPAPNAAGVSAGHLHMMVRDPDVHKKIWVDVLGAQIVNAGPLE